MAVKPFARMTGVLTAYGFGTKEVATALGCQLEKARDRMRNPGNLKLSELLALNKAGIPAEEIREAITFK